MAKKKVVMVIRRSPLNTAKNSEALRQCVGLTLAENEVTALLVDSAAWLSAPLSSEVIGGGPIRKHLEALLMLGVKVKVEAESLIRYGIGQSNVIPSIEIVDKEAVIEEITLAGAVIVF